MKIVSYCKSNPSTSLVQSAIDNGWLEPNDDWMFHEPSELLHLREGTLGIDARKIPTVISHKDDAVVLTEEFLVGLGFMWSDDRLLVLSTRSMDESIHILLQIGLNIQRWKLRNEVDCNNQCFFNSGHNKPTKICESCENILSQKGFCKEVIRIRALSALISEDFQEVSKTLEVNIAQAIQNLQLDFSNPILRITATNMILDHYLKTGSKKRAWVEDTSGIVLKHKDAIKQKYHRNKLPKIPFIIASRRWNSWTPNQPRQDSEEYQILHHKTGGGYFISDGMYALAVDPGYGFLDMLYRFHKVSVMDIDAVIITHDHLDHSSELQNILGLRFVYQKECQSRLQVYLNPSSYFLYERLLNYYSNILKDRKINPGQTITINNYEIKTIGMFHDEMCHKLDSDKLDGDKKLEFQKIISDSRSLGLNIFGNFSSGVPFNIAIPGDTSFPNDPSAIEDLAQFFGHPDIACIHLGSIEKAWADMNGVDASKIEYGERGHLGLNGVIKFINLIRPKVAIITEFGEELDASDIRLALTEAIKDLVVHKDITILPSDVYLFLAMNEDNIFFKCTSCGYFVPIEKVDVSPGKPENHFIEYSFESGCKCPYEHYVLENDTLCLKT